MPTYYQKPPETNQISMFLLSFFPQHFKMKEEEKKKRGGRRGGCCSPFPPTKSLPPPSNKQTGKYKLLNGDVITAAIFPKYAIDC